MLPFYSSLLRIHSLLFLGEYIHNIFVSDAMKVASHAVEIYFHKKDASKNLIPFDLVSNNYYQESGLIFWTKLAFPINSPISQHIARSSMWFVWPKKFIPTLQFSSSLLGNIFWYLINNITGLRIFINMFPKTCRFASLYSQLLHARNVLPSSGYYHYDHVARAHSWNFLH